MSRGPRRSAGGAAAAVVAAAVARAVVATESPPRRALRPAGAGGRPSAADPSRRGRASRPRRRRRRRAPRSTTTCSSGAGAAPARAVPPVATSCACTSSRVGTPTSRCSRAGAWSSTRSPRPTGNESIDGNIYFGRVQNVLPGMEAAFIDIGTPKNGVLYRGDVAFDKADLEGGNKPKIERMLKNGQMITVQVTKNPIAHKGARLTQEVSLAGRFLVMVPDEPETYGISKRLPDDERKRLRKVLDGIRPDDAGLIVRTAAEGATQRRARARRPPSAQPVGADLRAGEPVEAGEAPLPGARPRAAAHPRGVHQGVPRHRHRRPRPLRGDPRTTSRRSRPSSPTGSSTTTPRRRACRSSSGSTSPSSCSRRSTARCGCRRAVRSSSSAPRP